VADRTREALLVCEGAGYDVILVETVGIGQSEIAVRSMVDFFLVLLQPGAGDELQGIKKGALELADLLVVNKADGANLPAAERAQGEYTQALGLLRARSPNWTPVVLRVSSLDRTGIEEVWGTILEHSAKLEASGEREERRRQQAVAWMWSLVEEGLRSAFRSDASVASRIDQLERDVASLDTTPAAAARALLQSFKNS
jgi:LAO/AO transport system kinase